MSTRCILTFHYDPHAMIADEKKPEATIYRRLDGYPYSKPDAAGVVYGIGPDLHAFFEEVRKHEGVVGFDPRVLAAQFIVWDNRVHALGDSYLNMDHAFPVARNPGDAIYHYEIYCPFYFIETPEERRKRTPRVVYRRRSLETNAWSERMTLELPTPV